MAETETEAPAPGRADPSRERVIIWTILCLVVAFAAAVFVKRVKSLEGERFLGPFLESFVFQATLGGFAIYLARGAPEGWRRRLLLVSPRLSTGGVILLLLPSWALVIAGRPLRALGEMVFGRDPSPAYWGPLLDAAPVGWLIAFALVTSIGPGVCEELIFRGYLQDGLLKSMRPFAALLVTAVFFAAGHPPVPRAMSVLPHALWLGYLAYRTRSLVPSMLSHAVVNLTPDLMVLFRVKSDVMIGLWLILGAITLPLGLRTLSRCGPGPAQAAPVAP